MCIRICLHASMIYMCTTYIRAWNLQRPEEGITFLGPGVIKGCEPTPRILETEPRSSTGATNALNHNSLFYEFNELSHNWNHTLSFFLSLVYFSEHNDVKADLRCNTATYFEADKYCNHTGTFLELTVDE